MCGIVSIFQYDSGSTVDKQLLGRMTETMAHRGPDGVGYWVNPAGNVGLGHRRLAIIDPSPAGRQPMSNEDGTLWLPIREQVINLNRVLRGHYAYYGIAGNFRALQRIYRAVECSGHKILGGRSREGAVSWEAFHRIKERLTILRTRDGRSVDKESCRP